MIHRIPRSTIGIVSNVFVFNGDSRHTNGLSINSITVRRLPTVANSPMGVESQAESYYWTTDDLGQNIALWTPAGRDPLAASPLFVVCHGFGWDEKLTWNGQGGKYTQGRPERPFYKGLVTNGWIVASSFSFGDNWGNSNGVRSVSDLIRFTKRHFKVGAVWISGNSMGGLTALNWLAQHKGEADGLVAEYPVCSLSSMLSASQFSNSIVAAYGLAANGRNYRKLTAGFDPLVGPASRFGRVPSIWFFDPDEGVVPPCHRADQNRPLMGTSKPATLR